MFECISAFGSMATSVAASAAVWQLRANYRQARTQFEDSMSKEYRDLVQAIPTKALLGEPLTDEEFGLAQDEIYCYIDLSNGQIFLRQQRRVSEAAWVD